MLTLQSALVLPWDAFWVRRVFAEPISDPWIASEIVSEPFHVLSFFLLGRKLRHAFLEDFISLLGKLVELLVTLVIEDGLSELSVVSAIKLTWHYCSASVLSVIVL